MRIGTTSAMSFGVLVGLLTGYTPAARTAPVQDEQGILLDGHGRAISSLRPPGEAFLLGVAGTPQRSFTEIPRGKKFILTDVMYIAQGSLRQDATVNIASANPARQTHKILFQVRISPGESDDVHLCSGYVIPAGHSLVAFTNAGLTPDQYVSIAVTGRLADQ